MSIKKIAELAGTSPATVSRVLNNPNYRCSQKDLVEKIWKYAAQLQYVPNESAQKLKQGKTEHREKNFRIQILVTRSDGNFEDPFFSELLHVIRTELHRNQCILSRVWYSSAFSSDRIADERRSEHTIAEMHETSEEDKDGLIILGKCNGRIFNKIKREYRHIVSVNRNSTNYEVDEVLCDGKKIAALAVEHLVGLGHRKIAYVGECRNDARYLGYMQCLSDHDITLIPEFVEDVDRTEKAGYAVMQNFMTAEEKPTAFYCANDIIAVGMIKCLNRYRNRNYTPSIISSDNIEESQFTMPMLTTVNLPKEDMGKFAVYLLLDRIRGGHTNVVRMELEGNLIRRSSCSRVEEAYVTEYFI